MEKVHHLVWYRSHVVSKNIVIVFMIDFFLPLKCCTHRLTLLAPMQALLYVCLSLVWISNLGISSSTRKFITAPCRNPVYLHWNMTTWRGQVMWFSFHCEIMGGSSRHTTHCNIALCLVIIWHCSWIALGIEGHKTVIQVGNLCGFQSAMTGRYLDILNVAALSICTWIATTIDLHRVHRLRMLESVPLNRDTFNYDLIYFISIQRALNWDSSRWETRHHMWKLCVCLIWTRGHVSHSQHEVSSNLQVA